MYSNAKIVGCPPPKILAEPLHILLIDVHSKIRNTNLAYFFETNFILFDIYFQNGILSAEIEWIVAFNIRYYISIHTLMKSAAVVTL